MIGTEGCQLMTAKDITVDSPRGSVIGGEIKQKFLFRTATVFMMTKRKMMIKRWRRWLTAIVRTKPISEGQTHR